MENEKKNRNRHPTKENIQTVNKYVKKILSRICHQKIGGESGGVSTNSSTYYTVKTKTLPPTEQQDLSLVAGGNAKCYSHFRRQFGYFSQNNTYSYHDPTITWSLPGWTETHVYAQNNYAGFVHNCPDLKAIKMSVNR